VIICAYVGLTQQELVSFKPKLVYLGENNQVTHTRNTIPVQAA
jgi:aspartate 1-decarboxylase